MEDYKDLILSRTIQAHVDVIWEAWVNAEQLKIWWGPKDFTNPVCEIDVRAGGKIYIEMQSPEGTIYPMNGEYAVISKPKRIVFTNATLNPQGMKLFDEKNTVNFTEAGAATNITLQIELTNITPEATPYLEGMEEGWNQIFDKLAVYVTKD